MPFDLLGLGRLRAFQHTLQGFTAANIDTSASIGSYRDVRWMAGNPSTAQAMISNDSVVQRQWEENASILGFRSGSFQLKSYLCPTGQALNTAAAATKTTQSLIMESIAGGYSAAGGSTVQASSTATSLIVGTGHGVRFPVGSCVFVQYASGVQMGRVTAVSTDTLTVFGLNGVPTVSNSVFNSQIIYPADDPTTAVSLLLERAVDRDNIWWLFAGQGGLEFSLSLGEAPSWSTSLTFPEWKQNASASTPLAGAIAAASYDGGQPFGFTGGSLRIGDVGGSLVSQHFSALTFAPNISYSPVPSPEGVNGVLQWRMQRAGAPTMSFTVPFEDAAYWTKRAASTLQTGFFTIGSTAGSMLGFDFPRMQIMDVQNEDSSGLAGVKVTMKLLEDSTTTTALSRAPWRFCQA
jgi:hypothetical protein